MNDLYFVENTLSCKKCEKFINIVNTTQEQTEDIGQEATIQQNQEEILEQQKKKYLSDELYIEQIEQLKKQKKFVNKILNNEQVYQKDIDNVFKKLENKTNYPQECIVHNKETCELILDDSNDICKNIINEEKCNNSIYCKYNKEKLSCENNKKKCIYLDSSIPTCKEKCEYIQNKTKCNYAVDNDFNIDLEESKYCIWDEENNKCNSKCKKYKTKDGCNGDIRCNFNYDLYKCEEK